MNYVLEIHRLIQNSCCVTILVLKHRSAANSGRLISRNEGVES